VCENRLNIGCSFRKKKCLDAALSKTSELKNIGCCCTLALHRHYVIRADNRQGPREAVHVFTNRYRRLLGPRLWCLILGFCAPIRSFTLLDTTLTAYWSIAYWLRVRQFLSIVSRHSAVGMATIYGLGGPRKETRWARFSPPIRTGPTQPPVQWVPGLPWGRPGHGVVHPPPILHQG
jgi:hypothetical protein